MLGSIEQFSLQPLGFAVRAVWGFGAGKPKRIILSGIGDIPGITYSERIAAFQVSKISCGVSENDAIIDSVLQISA